MAYTQAKSPSLPAPDPALAARWRCSSTARAANFISAISAADSLDETLALLSRQDVAADGQVLDVADKAAVHAWAERIAAARGHVDIVINNAGVALMSTVEDSDYETSNG